MGLGGSGRYSKKDKMKTETKPQNNLSDFEMGDFDDYLNSTIHDVLKTLTILAMILVPFFFILDFYTMPKELLQEFGLYRLICTLIIIVQYIFVRQSEPTRLSFVHGYFFSVIVAGMISLMTVELGGFNSSYYAGLNLVIFGINLFLPWKALHAAANSIIVVAMYILLNITISQDYVQSTLINNLFFLFSTAIISVSISHVKYRLVTKEFFLLVELKKARDALWTEMELAKRIQTALLPHEGRIKGFDVAAKMIPATEVGGDYYDIIETSNGDTWITIGDVSGHGVDSGLIMMMAQTSIISMVNDCSECKPSEVLASVNRVLRENIERLGSDHYMTILAIRFDESQMILAGKHQDIIIYRSALNKTEVVSTQGTWLGISDDIEKYLKDKKVNLDDGDIVLFFTDGITEATDKNGEMYGLERLEQAVNQYADLPAGKLVDRIIAGVSFFQDEQSDDITLLVAKKRSNA